MTVRGASLILTASLLAAPALAQAPPLVLHLPASVRAAGLNGAAAALVGNAGSVFGNPAGLATIRHIALEAGLRPEPGGARVATVAGAWRLRQFDLGGGVQHYTLGTSSTGTGRPRELLAAGSLVYRFGLLAAGATVKTVRTNVTGVERRGWAGDLGFAIAVFDIMAIGFSMQNVGGNLDDSSPLPLPRLTRLGFTMNYVDPQESFRLMSDVEIQWPEGRGARGVVGGEAGTVLSGVGVVGRVAYGSRWGAYQPSSVTYGGSLVLTRLILDYAYEPGADGLARHRVGLRLTL